MKQALLFALSFAALSLLLTWLWLGGGNALYAAMMQPIANSIYDALGLPGHGTMRRLRFINFVPFTALMILTPRLSMRRRLGGLAIGWLVLAAFHIALNGIAISAATSQKRLPPMAAFTSDAMPFLIWYVIARDFVQATLRRVQGRTEPGGEAP
jgi:hypothetical protein